MSKKYLTISDFILGLIKDFTIKPGDRLPSVRHLSEKFQCSKSTVLRALRELEEQHIIYSVPKSGYYLIDNRKHSSITNDIIDFSSAAPDSDSLPYREFQHSINQAIDIYKENLFSYTDPQGLTSLRQIICKYLYDYQVFTKVENIFITTGTQQALDILTRMDFPNGKNNILVEQPTYSVMLRLLEVNHKTTLGITRTYSGIDFNELEGLFKNGNIKFFYTIPSLHNPLGASYSIEDKIRILKLAQEYDVYIIEDDYLRDIEINTKSDPIFSNDTMERVIYIRSFSKTFMPGLRIGAIILPNKLINVFSIFKKTMDLNTPVLSQGALEIFIKSGMLYQHLEKMKKRYLDRMSHLSKLAPRLEELGVKPYIPETGFFAWFDLPLSYSATKLRERLTMNDVLITDSNVFFHESFRRDNSFRLSISKCGNDKIEEGVSRIYNELKNMNNIKNYKVFLKL